MKIAILKEHYQEGGKKFGKVKKWRKLGTNFFRYRSYIWGAAPENPGRMTASLRHLKVFCLFYEDIGN